MTSWGVCTCQLASVFLLLAPTDTEKIAAGWIDSSTGVSVPSSARRDDEEVRVSPAERGASITTGVAVPEGDADADAEAATVPKARNMSSSVYAMIKVTS